MAKANISIARTDRYTHGLKVPSEKTKSGFRLDKSKPRDENDPLFCKKGDTYYWWKFQNSPKRYSLTPPKPSQLTQNPFYQAVYSIAESIDALDINSFESESDMESFKEETIGEIEEIVAELDEKISNMESYDGLSESPACELLRERLDAVQQWQNDIDNVDATLDLESIRADVEMEYSQEDIDEMDESDYENELEERVSEKANEIILEFIEAMQDCLFDL